MKKEARHYIYASDLFKDTTFVVRLVNTEISENQHFYNELLEMQSENTWLTRKFEISDLGEVVVSVIHSVIPFKLVAEKLDVINDIALEQVLDKENRVQRFKKEIVLSWPNSEEANVLQVDEDSRVIVEKTIFYDKNGLVIRYEEEVSQPEFYEFME